MNNKTIIKLIFSITLAIILVVSNFYVISLINNDLEKIAKTKKDIIAEQNKKNIFSDVEEKIQQLEIIESRINDVLISEREVDNFISTLEKMAVNSGVEVTIGKVDFKELEEDKLGTLSMNLSFSGSWESVNSYVESIEKLQYLKKINAIRLSKSNQGWSVNFILEIKAN
jgi:Tfp pilus assembly protein PilO